ncbi:DUF1997 domain-containing protein [Spirulina sp. CS-785/01]|uniref:DUF1997 domain-containing protein n=1 Tax=Spirulina sp. CS-785/01 TaxID=3021716 RepID=UPI002331431E|nr:DUF1997 domain-containing protein [Spirulina sp. CS-785/01]MDB9312598.1 DUF1997 domain-containing protein [Spirulina sp. CS-785/01]
MQSQFADDRSFQSVDQTQTPELSSSAQTEPPEDTETPHTSFTFETHFQGCMGMYSPPDTVAEYLDAHEGWFCRCAQPMTAEPLGENGYILTVGQFGAFGYEVEPKMAVKLDPPQNGVYEMYSVVIPDYTPPGYDVDYHASMTLAEMDPSDVQWKAKPQVSPVVTQVTWQLHLGVTIQFPQFIYKLPNHILQKTGDRVLSQIVRQISPRLTYKVQKDFHDRMQLPLPPKKSRKLVSLNPTEDSETTENTDNEQQQ